MKRFLLLLLLSVAAFGQTPTPGNQAGQRTDNKGGATFAKELGIPASDAATWPAEARDIHFNVVTGRFEVYYAGEWQPYAKLTDILPTNLSNATSATDITIYSSTGTGTVISLANATKAGLLPPAGYTVLSNTSGTNTGDNAPNTNSNAYADNAVTNYNIQQPIVTPIEVSHTFIKETKPRRKNVDWSGLYTGTVRTVCSTCTYTTISAAVSAAVSGDIIQIQDGTYAMESESGGYYNHVNITKNLVIQGNASNNGAVILQQTTSTNPYCFRIQRSVNLTIKNLTIQTNQANAAVIMNTNTVASGTNVVFDNCVMKCTDAANHRTVLVQGIPSNTNYIELKNCDIYANGSSGSLATCIGFESQVSDATQASFPTYILITGGKHYGWTNWENGCNDVSMYDVYCEQNQYASGVVFRYGKDTEVPFSTNSKLDVRGCTFKYASTYQGHGVLLGRGTKNVYFANNHVFVPKGSPDSGLALGIVIKSIAASVGDVIIEGNAVVAPRPLYIKGGQNTIIRYNTSEATWSANDTGAGWEINNPVNSDGALTSQGNVLMYNKFIGKVAGGITTTASGATDAFLSAQACTIDNNTYQIKNNGVLYFFKESIGNFTNWADRSTLWGNSNDSHSVLLTYYKPSGTINVDEGEKTVTVNGKMTINNTPSAGSNEAVRMVDLLYVLPSKTTVTSAYSTSTARLIICDTSAAAFTVTMTVSGVPDGIEYTLVNKGTSNNVIIQVAGGGTINGSPTYTLFANNKVVKLSKDGSNFIITN